jgi:hypothetical protein
MRLVQISAEVLINPEHVSHIRRRIEPPPENGGQYAHPYPVFRVTMYDGKWYDLAWKHEYAMEDDSYPFMALSSLIQDLTQGH